MPISVTCSGCKSKLNAPDGAAGKKVKCPKCQSPILVPEAMSLDADFEVVDEQPAPPAKKGLMYADWLQENGVVDEQPAPPAKKEPAKPGAKPKPKVEVVLDEDEEEEEKKPKKKAVKAEVELDEDDKPRKKKPAAAADDHADEEPSASGAKRRAMLLLACNCSLSVGVVLLALWGFGAFSRTTKPVRNEQPVGSTQSAEVKSQPTSKLTAENYLRVKVGMQSDELLLILGPPSETEQFGLSFHDKWKEGDKFIYVVIEGGKVKSKWQIGLH